MIVKTKFKKELFVVAIKDGEEVHVDQFKSGEGLDCGCTCPKCGKPVISNVSIRTDLKRKFTNHFSHHNPDLDSTCSGVIDETELIVESSPDYFLWLFILWGMILIIINRKRIFRFFMG